MADDHDDHWHQHVHWQDTLAALMAAVQWTPVPLANDAGFNRQPLEINADVKTTLARIETLSARMLPTGENGREA